MPPVAEPVFLPEPVPVFVYEPLPEAMPVIAGQSAAPSRCTLNRRW